MLPLSGRIFFRRGRGAARLWFFAQEVQDFLWCVGGERVLLECFEQVEFCSGWIGNAFLQVLLALLLDFEHLQEELLRVGTHLRGGATFHRSLDKFPIFSVLQQG